jgi:hypothetical protein
MNQTSRQIKPTFFHFENDFDEGRIQRFIATGLSNEGPAMAIADVNGDGLSDFYMGGARKQKSALYMQDSAGLFTPKETEAWEAAIPAEEVNALFFDVDQDNDMDLFVSCGGGGDALGNGQYLQDILYINDGNGNFASDIYFPEYEFSTQALAAGDFDGDGDLDLFVGGRNLAGLYPQSPPSFLWRNDGGTWTEVTTKMFPDGPLLGNLTDADWTDWNGDGMLDLVVTGEWMAPTIYVQTKGKFQVYDLQELSNLKGIWNTMELADLDADGDMDILLGNMGQNGMFHPSPTSPVHLYAFLNSDQTRRHIVYGVEMNGQIWPIANRSQMMLLIPDLDIRYPDNNSYAVATLTDILGKSIIDNSIHLEISTVSSCAIYHGENGTITIQELPIEAQVAPVYAFVVHDWNQDGQVDICLAGNNRHVGDMMTPLDAGIGLYLKGSELDGFIPIPQVIESGFYLPNDVRHMGIIEIGKTETAILVAKNSGRLNLLVWSR